MPEDKQKRYPHRKHSVLFPIHASCTQRLCILFADMKTRNYTKLKPGHLSLCAPKTNKQTVVSFWRSLRDFFHFGTDMKPNLAVLVSRMTKTTTTLHPHNTLRENPAAAKLDRLRTPPRPALLISRPLTTHHRSLPQQKCNIVPKFTLSFPVHLRTYYHTCRKLMSYRQKKHFPPLPLSPWLPDHSSNSNYIKKKSAN